MKKKNNGNKKEMLICCCCYFERLIHYSIALTPKSIYEYYTLMILMNSVWFNVP